MTQTPTMRAAAFREFGPPDVLRVEQFPVPEPGDGEVLVRVSAAGVNPIDCKTRAGQGRPVPDFPAVIGWDVAGTVAATGPGVDTFSVGDPVFGMPRFPSLASCYAEYVAVPAAELSPLPPGIGMHEAGAAPMVALTAWQTLFEHAQLQAGQQVLVHGAAGGVGHVVVQLAKEAKAHVTGTASARNEEFVLGLGAERVVGYAGRQLEATVRDADVVVDTRGGADFERLLGVLRPGGVIVSLLGKEAGHEQAARARGVRAGFTYVAPDGQTLGKIAQLMADGGLRIRVSQVFQLEQAAMAHAASEQGHVRGRLVLDATGGGHDDQRR
jgi:NADPH:quinone reductase-like Zn-dependent oxidoreductase